MAISTEVDQLAATISIRTHERYATASPNLISPLQISFTLHSRFFWGPADVYGHWGSLFRTQNFLMENSGSKYWAVGQKKLAPN